MVFFIFFKKILSKIRLSLMYIQINKLRWVSFKSSSLSMQSKTYQFSPLNDLHQLGKRVGNLANCETLIPYSYSIEKFLFLKNVLFGMDRKLERRKQKKLSYFRICLNTGLNSFVYANYTSWILTHVNTTWNNIITTLAITMLFFTKH